MKKVIIALLALSGCGAPAVDTELSKIDSKRIKDSIDLELYLYRSDSTRRHYDSSIRKTLTDMTETTECQMKANKYIAEGNLLYAQGDEIAARKKWKIGMKYRRRFNEYYKQAIGHYPTNN